MLAMSIRLCKIDLEENFRERTSAGDRGLTGDRRGMSRQVQLVVGKSQPLHYRCGQIWVNFRSCDSSRLGLVLRACASACLRSTHDASVWKTFIYWSTMAVLRSRDEAGLPQFATYRKNLRPQSTSSHRLASTLPKARASFSPLDPSDHSHIAKRSSR